MCLVLFAVAPHPAVPLVVLANRDELHRRPSALAARWADAPHVFAGRDLEKGGTWLGVGRGGRFGAVTNVRHPSARKEGRSRGALVADFLRGDAPARAFAEAIDRPAFPAFNLLLADEEGVFYTNELGELRALAPGIHGLSNARLDDPWPKVERGKAALARGLGALPGPLDDAAAFAALSARAFAPDPSLPSTGVDIALERALSPAFVELPGYGTRSQTRLVLRRDGGGARADFAERAFGEGGAPIGEVDERVDLGA